MFLKILKDLDLKRRSSYIPSPEWLLAKKAVVNPKNKKDNYCLAYATTTAIYHNEIARHIDIISNKLLDCTEKLDWNGIDFPASTPDCKRFEKNKEDIALNIMYVPYENDEEEVIDVLPEYISKDNFSRRKQIVLLKISNGKRWHFLALKSETDNNRFLKPTKSFSRLMRDISSSVHENHYCFGCFHSFRCEATLEKHTRLCKDNDSCKIKLPNEYDNIKKHDMGSKSLKMNYIVYVDLECLLVNYDTCLNTPNKSHAVNIAQHIPSGYAITALDESQH